jgi:nucleoside-diphosphate-sugar epimerase
VGQIGATHVAQDVGLSGTRVAVTGASGFVGSHLVRHLLRDGAGVVGVVRNAGNIATRDNLRIATVADLADPNCLSDLRQAVRGTSIVVHLAARTHTADLASAANYREYARANVASTELVVQAAAAENVRRVVYLSSIKVNGEASEEPGFSQAHQPTPRDNYGRSKLAAELALADAAVRAGLEYVIVRVPALLGAGVKGNLALLARLVAAGVPLPLARLANRRSYMGVRNLSDALIRACCEPEVTNSLLLLADTPALSTTQLLQHMGRASGRSARLFPLPRALIEAAVRWRGELSPLHKVFGSLVVDEAPSVKQLRFSPAYTIEAEIAEMFGGGR